MSDYGTLSNWSTESTTGADATALPESGDQFYYKGDYAFDLRADFPIAVWKDGEGNFTADALNVGMYLSNGGKLVPVMMTDGEDFSKGDTITVGKISKTSPLPAVKSGWVAMRNSIEGDDTYDVLSLKRGRGFQVIFR